MASCSRCSGSFDESHMYKDSTGQLTCRLCLTPEELQREEQEAKRKSPYNMTPYRIVIGAMLACSGLVWCWFFMECGSDRRLTTLLRPDMANRDAIPFALTVALSAISAGLAALVWWRVWGMRIKEGLWVKAVVTRVYAFRWNEDFLTVDLKYSVDGREYRKKKTIPRNVKEGESIDVYVDRGNPKRLKLFE